VVAGALLVGVAHGWLREDLGGLDVGAGVFEFERSVC
jgi:hypothetical protein